MTCLLARSVGLPCPIANKPTTTAMNRTTKQHKRSLRGIAGLVAIPNPSYPLCRHKNHRQHHPDAVIVLPSRFLFVSSFLAFFVVLRVVVVVGVVFTVVLVRCCRRQPFAFGLVLFIAVGLRFARFVGFLGKAMRSQRADDRQSGTRNSQEYRGNLS